MHCLGQLLHPRSVFRICGVRAAERRPLRQVVLSGILRYPGILARQVVRHFTAGSLAFFDCGGVRLMLSPAEKPEFDHPGSILYYRVADIEAAHADLTGRGVEFIDQPHLIHKAPDHDLWMTFFHDTEGNTAGLMCEKPRA